MSKELSILFENIEEKEVKEMIELILFDSEMLECKVSVEYRPNSFFEISIKTPNRKHKLNLNIKVNARKKYLVDINLNSYKYKINGIFIDSEHNLVQSGHIAPNFMLPLEEVRKILANC